MREQFEDDVINALEVLKRGGVILYPTDTIWGLGCDATNAKAIDKVYRIKQRHEEKSLIIMVADEREILQYVAAPDLLVFDLFHPFCILLDLLWSLYFYWYFLNLAE